MKKLYRRIKHWYIYDLKLRNKLLISHLLLIFLPTVVLSLFLYTRLYDIIISDTILTEQALASQTASTIEATLSQVTQASDTLTQNTYFENLFMESGSGLYPSTLSSRIQALKQTVDSLTDGELVTAIRIYADDSMENVIASDDGSMILPLSSVTGTYWYGIFSSTDCETLFCPDLYLSVTEEEELGSLAYIRRIESYDGLEVYLAVYFSGDRLDSVLASNVTMNNSAAYILNERDTVTASSSEVLSGAYYMSNSTVSGLVEGENLYSTRTYLEDNLYVGYYSIEGTEWHLVSILSYESLANRGMTVVVQIIGIYLLFFLLALIMSITLSNSIANRISKIIRQMQTVHHSRPLRIDSGEGSRDEIGDLVETYNYMSDEINVLLEQQAKAAEELKLQEYKALQSQINPHFLYNSLDMISWLAKSGEGEEVSEAVEALSDFYKLTLSRDDAKATVSLELEHVSLYVKLQNMRYEDKISFFIDMPQELMDYEIPKLTLQPIIENSILHGIMEKPEKTGVILVTGWLEGSELVILVSDDGVGMSKEKLSTILEGSGPSDGSGSNIGIYNTHSRLKLLYGEEYGLHYESEPGGGTQTFIRIPAIHGS